MNLLLTGPKQVGKTTVCQGLIRLMHSRNLNPTGLLTPAFYNKLGKKIGFSALNISNGESWHLASTQENLNGPQIGIYKFDQDALELAMNVLKNACHNPKDILIIDEFGRLELDQNLGFAPILNLLPLNGHSHLLLVARTKFLFKLQQRLTPASFQIVEVTIANRGSVPSQLITKLWG